MNNKILLMCICCLGFLSQGIAQVTNQHVWVNEFRYDNLSNYQQDDQRDFVEIIISNQLLSSSDINDYKLVLYSSNGYDNDVANSLRGKGLPYHEQSILYDENESSMPLGVEDATAMNGFRQCPVDGTNYTVLYREVRLQDVPSAFAIIYDNPESTAPIQLISYERAFKIKDAPEAGVAAGKDTELITDFLGLTLTQGSLTASDHSIQLLGSGNNYDAYSWEGTPDLSDSPCEVNAGQSIDDLECINPVIDNPGTQEACESFDLSTLPITGSFLTGNQKYYDNDQANGGQEITDPITEQMTVWIYDASGACSDEISFQVNINLLPDITNPGVQEGCDELILPAITGTNLTGSEAYYNDSQENGGTVISNVLTQSQMVWIYDASAPSCDDEESFMANVYITPKLADVADVQECDSYTLPAIQGTDLTGNEAYYSSPNGQDPITGPITSNQTVYVYDINNGCAAEKSFEVSIINTPQLDPVADVTMCDSYTLPAISGTDLTPDAAYFEGENGSGEKHLPNDEIKETTTLYVYDVNNGCAAQTASFTITINLTPDIVNPGNIISCSGAYTLPEIEGTNLTGNEKYYTDTQVNGGGDTKSPGDIIIGGTTLYIYDETGTTPNCSDEEMFTITTGGPHSIDELDTQVSCGPFTFPPITGSVTGNEKYYDDDRTNVLANEFEPGSVTSTPGTYYMYDRSGEVCATDEKSFNLTINPQTTITAKPDVAACDSYTLSDPIEGDNLSGGQAYYSSPGGVDEITAPITSSQTVYMYDINNGCTAEESFEVVITTSPALAQPDDQDVCDSYALPTSIGGTDLNTPKYYDGPQSGSPNELSGVITSDMMVWVYDSRGECSDEKSFMVTVTPTPNITNPGDITQCDSYDLPAIEGDNVSTAKYYDNSQAMGGQEISGTITSTMKVWIYADNGNSCTDETSFDVNITDAPVLDQPDDESECDSYTLPTIQGQNLVSPKYYDNSQTNGGQVISGDITSTMTVWVYDAAGACSDEKSFEVTITESPQLSPKDPVVECDEYLFPAISGSNLNNPAYYTQPEGMGTMFEAGASTTTGGTMYIYDIRGNCPAEQNFNLTINNTPDLDDISDPTVCESYTLLAITGSNRTGNEAYYLEPNGQGDPVDVGTAITTTQKLYIYDAVGTCSDQEDFTVTIDDLDGGAIGSDQTIDSGNAPAELTETSPSSSSGLLFYQWESRTASTSYADISGATDKNYSPGVLNETTYFKRTTFSRTNGTVCSEESEEITITVQESDPLPVSWLYIRAKLLGKDNLIEWATEEENNTTGFHVEWSTNGQDFHEIGFVKSNNQAGEYEFLHENPSTGVHYYRIQQMDQHGKAAESAVVILSRKEGIQDAFTAFPSPTNGNIQLNIPEAFDLQQKIIISVYDANGQLAKSSLLTSNQRFDISNLPAGIYLIIAEQGTQRANTRIVKMD